MPERVFSQTFGVVGAIIEKDGKFLLVQENSKRADFGKYNQPAGWLEVGEDPISAVKREVKEETGLDFQPTALIGIYSIVKENLQEGPGIIPHGIKLIFMGTIQGELIVGNEEISALRWFTPAEIELLDGKTLRDIDIKQEVRDYLANKTYPLELIRHTIQTSNS